MDYLVSIQTRDGNFPCATDELGRNARTEEEMLVHWCVDAGSFVSCGKGGRQLIFGFQTGRSGIKNRLKLCVTIYLEKSLDNLEL